MITDKQLAANRLNAQRSTGPRTHKGKNRSKLNALRHNLTGQVSAMTEDDRLFYDLFIDGVMKSLAPENALELQLAQRIAHDHWRLNRAAAIEDNIFALGYDASGGHAHEHPQIDAAWTAARVYKLEAKNLELLSIYEQRLNRTLQKNLAELKALQAERKAERRAAFDEAALLAQAPVPAEIAEAEANTTPAQIAEITGFVELNGFVFRMTK